MEKGHALVRQSKGRLSRLRSGRYQTIFRKTKTKEYVKIMDEYEKYKNITVDELWKNEINEFLEAYDKFLTGLSELDKKNEKHKK
jgi:hypothetical protein